MFARKHSALLFAVMLAAGVLSLIFASASAQSTTQSDLYEFEDDLEGWQPAISGAVSHMLTGADLPDRQPGSAKWLLSGASLRKTELLIEGRYHLSWDWYYTGSGFQLSIESADESQETINLTQSVIDCQRNGVDWVIGQWNECAADIQFVTYITSTHELTREIAIWATTGSLDHFQIVRTDVPGGTPLTTPTPTPTGTTPSTTYYYHSYYDESTPPTYIDAGGFLGETVYPDQWLISGGRFGSGSSGYVGWDTNYTPTVDVYGYVVDAICRRSDGGNCAIYYPFNTGYIPTRTKTCYLPNDIDPALENALECDNVLYTTPTIHTFEDRVLFRPPTREYMAQMQVFEIGIITGDPIDPLPPAIDPIAPTTPYTATCTDGTTSANLLEEPSFESGLYSAWEPAILDWSIVGPASEYTPSLRYATDGDYSLYSPANTAAGAICQTFYSPTDTLTITIGIDAIASAGLNSGSKNISLSLNDTEIAAYTITPTDTQWIEISGTGGTGGPINTGYNELCIISAGGATGVYLDRAYAVVSVDSGLSCPAGTLPPPDPAPTPAPTPIPVPPPDNTPDTDSSGGACYDCIRPDGSNWAQLGVWIRWLLCGINNLFYCALYGWLLVIGNYLSGVWVWLDTTAAWIAATLNSWAVWLGNTLNGLAAYLAGLLNSVAGLIGLQWEAFSTWLAGTLNGWADWIANTLNGWADWIANALNAWAAWLVDRFLIVWTFLESLIMNTYSALYYNLKNWLGAIWEWMVSGATWLGDTIQLLITWLGEWFTRMTGGAIYFIEWVKESLSSMVRILSFGWEMLGMFGDVIAYFWDLVMTLVRGFFSAWSAPAYTMEEIWGVDAIEGFNTDGPSLIKVLWAIFAAIGVADEFLGHPAMITFGLIVFALIGWNIAQWSIKEFQALNI